VQEGLDKRQKLEGGGDAAMNEFRCEKLADWQKAIGIADGIHERTQNFPRDRQIQPDLANEASGHVHIVEGSGRISGADFARFIEIASGSLKAVVSPSFLSQRRRFVSIADLEHLENEALEMSRRMSGLRTRLAAI
jgi:four helix bundle protein